VVARDPGFAVHAGGVLDLYERRRHGKRLDRGDCVNPGDEQPQLQARAAPPRAGGRARSVIVSGPATSLGRR
jgi:hypothetical protein